MNAVAPGPIEDELWTEPGGLADQIAKRKRRRRATRCSRAPAPRPPLGRMGTARRGRGRDRVPLLARRPRNVTGAAWAVDGGSVPVS